MLFGSEISWWWWKTREPQFSDLVQWPTAIIRPKSRNLNIRHGGVLSIGNFMLMINNHFVRFQLPGNLLKTKKMCYLFSWPHAISYLFSMYLCCTKTVIESGNKWPQSTENHSTRGKLNWHVLLANIRWVKSTYILAYIDNFLRCIECAFLCHDSVVVDFFTAFLKKICFLLSFIEGFAPFTL
jgi:hypothetical protein